jgi:hypothetical protein
MKKYKVIIPYYYEFNVEAEDENDALDKIGSMEGDLICRGEDSEAEIEEEKD